MSLLRLIKLIIPATIFIFLGASFVSADQYSSSNYTVTDPVVKNGQFSTTSSYQLFGTFGEVDIGTSTSSNYGVNAGFLYFPFVSIPVLTTTPGDSQITVNWTAASGSLGWNVSAYTIGQSTTAGGPYSYSQLANVLTSTRTGLTNGTRYYFVIRVQDAFNNFIATSTEVSDVPASSGATTPPAGGGGGGGGGSSTINFNGFAYPGSRVVVLRDGAIAVSANSQSSGAFVASLGGLSGGTYTFVLYAEDADARRSPPLTYTVSVLSGSSVTVSDIYFPPTLSLDKSKTKKGNPVTAIGYSVPNKDIAIVGYYGSETAFNIEARSDGNGRYSASIQTALLPFGIYGVLGRLKIFNDSLRLLPTKRFEVGNEDELSKERKGCPERGDLDGDCRVNLTDFSIGAYWWKITLSNEFSIIEKEQLNGDGVMDIIDFSIMAYHWTG